jgi:hypothetical protein
MIIGRMSSLVGEPPEPGGDSRRAETGPNTGQGENTRIYGYIYTHTDNTQGKFVTFLAQISVLATRQT